MGHIWSRFGNGMAKLWPIYLYYVDLTLPYIANPYPVTVLNYCHSIVFSYEIATYLAKNLYIHHRILYVNGMGVPHIIQPCSVGLLCIFSKNPYTHH